MIRATNVSLPSPLLGRGEKGRGCAAFPKLESAHQESPGQSPTHLKLLWPLNCDRRHQPFRDAGVHHAFQRMQQGRVELQLLGSLPSGLRGG